MPRFLVYWRKIRWILRNMYACWDRHEWDNKIQFDFDIYHMSGWDQIVCTHWSKVTQRLIITWMKKTLLFPLIIRRLDDKYWDITSTYGYSGVLASTNLTETEIDKMLTAAIDYLKDRHCVSWFLRLHPILNANWFSHVGHLVAHGPTLSSDLTKQQKNIGQKHNKTSKRHQKKRRKSAYNKIEQLNNRILKSLSISMKRQCVC